MKRPPRGDMPLALTLPLHFDLGLRARRRRLRRLLVAALAIAVAVLLAAGVWLPARAALEDGGAALADLAIGDAFTLRRPDGAVRTYEVIALATPWPFDGTAVGGQWHYVVTGRLRL